MKLLSTIKTFSAALLLTSSALYGQITIDNSTFPEIGDTLFTVVDSDPSISVGEAGEDLTWDFRSLNGPFVRERRFLDALESEASEDFSEATMVAQAANEQEIFYKSFNNKILEIGRAGEIVPGFDVPAPYSKEPTFRRAPLSYQDFNDDDLGLSVSLSADIVPEELLMGLPIDSFRITVEGEIESIVDAWGTVMLPDSDHEVLREKVVSVTNTKLFTKTFLGWTELDPALLGGLGDFGDFLGATETITYNFHSNDSKELIASVQVDEDDNALSVEFMGSQVTTDIKVIAPDANVITVFPNPSFGNVSIQMVNYPIGNYRMKVYNVVGKELWAESFQLRSNRVFKADLMHLSKGTYLYSIFDKDGKKLVTKRIAIISI